MIVISDLKIMYEYWDNGNVRWLAEYKDRPNNHTGIYAEWCYNGNIKELSYRKNNLYHGLKKFWIPMEVQYSDGYFSKTNSKYYLRYYFNNGMEISDKINHLVKDIENVTDEEKTMIALLTGITL